MLRGAVGLHYFLGGAPPTGRGAAKNKGFSGASPREAFASSIGYLLGYDQFG
jgi:hypothetical protein